jgi:class 3 adenylate cyclase
LLRRESIRTAEEAIRTLEAERRQAHYRKYLSANVADYVMSNPEAMGLGGVRRTATVMFVDLRDFTPFSEKERPEFVVEVLNRVFSVLVEIVFRHGGTLDKFLGDGLMAVFGVPQPMSDDRGAAVAAALEMLGAVRRLDAAGVSGGATLHIGIGLAHGDVIAGHVGSADRMEFTAIGDTVNYAARLQALCKDFAQDLVVSESVYEAVHDRYECAPMPPVHIKGKSGEPKTWAITGESAERSPTANALRARATTP